MKSVTMKEVYSQATRKHDKSRKYRQFFRKKWQCCAPKIDPPSQLLQELHLKSVQKLADTKIKKIIYFSYFLQNKFKKT